MVLSDQFQSDHLIEDHSFFWVLVGVLLGGLSVGLDGKAVIQFGKGNTCACVPPPVEDWRRW